MALTSRLEEYKAIWPRLFEIEKLNLLPLFGEGLVAIHHVGSTSIPGMIAKPEIDMLVVLKEHEDLHSYFSKIEALGYDFRGEEPGQPGHWYFSKNQIGKRTHKLHLCGPKHPCVENQLLFRNFLNADPDRAELYRKLKVHLADTNCEGMAEYVTGKTPFIEETLSLARKLMGTDPPL
jgi:GrpB-like predicted nucleotidyltransferase (UPF0157 family)